VRGRRAFRPVEKVGLGPGGERSRTLVSRLNMIRGLLCSTMLLVLSSASRVGPLFVHGMPPRRCADRSQDDREEEWLHVKIAEMDLRST
jgi:hypothetical protein